MFEKGAKVYGYEIIESIGVGGLVRYIRLVVLTVHL